MAKIMGLDLATKKTGWSIFHDDKLIDYGIFFADKNEVNVHSRILQIKKQILNKIKEHKIEHIIIENVPINLHSNLKIGMDLIVLQGVILSVCDDLDLGLQLLSPSSWRSSMGLYDGTRATMKRDCQKQKAIDMVNEIYGFDFKYYKSDTKTKISDDDKAESILLVMAYNKILKENEK